MIDPSLTQNVRMYCDGELTPEAARQFERELEGDVQLQQAVVFERNLRKHLDVVLTRESTKAPAALLSRIQQSLADESVPAPLQFDASKAAHPTWRVNLFAVAAVLVLVVGAVIFGIVFPQIDAFNSTPIQSEDPSLFFATIGSFVANEHDRLSSNKELADKLLPLNDRDDTDHELSQHLKSRVTTVDLSGIGYTFYGGGVCSGALPCGGPSGRFLYKVKRDDGTFTGPNISLFFVPEDRVAEFLQGDQQRRWVINNEPDRRCGHKVLRLDYPETGLVYFLVTCDPDDLERAAKLVLEQLHAASRRR